MNINTIIEEARVRLESGFPRLPANSDAVMPHIERFVKEINLDQALDGLVMQVAIAKPYLADKYVFSINIAGSSKDSQAAVDAQSRVPDDAEQKL